MAAFKVVKKSEWTTQAGKKGTTLVLAASGRVVTANVEDFDKGLTIKDDICSINVPFVVTKDSYIGNDGNARTGFRIKPKVDWEFSEF